MTCTQKMKQIWFECFKKKSEIQNISHDLDNNFFGQGETCVYPGPVLIFSCKDPAASCNIAYSLRNLNCSNFLSGDELSIPFKPPYGLFFEAKSK